MPLNDRRSWSRIVQRTFARLPPRCCVLREPIAGPAEGVSIAPGAIVALTNVPLGRLPADFTCD